MEQALVTTLDENLDYRIGKSIPQGDSCCEHILSKRTRSSADGTDEGRGA
jgi:hypothetical protein